MKENIATKTRRLVIVAAMCVLLGDNAMRSGQEEKTAPFSIADRPEAR
jgi:hypothetical protein